MQTHKTYLRNIRFYGLTTALLVLVTAVSAPADEASAPGRVQISDAASPVSHEGDLVEGHACHAGPHGGPACGSCDLDGGTCLTPGMPGLVLPSHPIDKFLARMGMNLYSHYLAKQTAHHGCPETGLRMPGHPIDYFLAKTSLKLSAHYFGTHVPHHGFGHAHHGFGHAPLGHGHHPLGHGHFGGALLPHHGVGVKHLADKVRRVGDKLHPQGEWGHARLQDHVHDHLRCRYGYFCPTGCCGAGCPWAGHYHMGYAWNPEYFDSRDGGVYAAQGYGIPMAVPLAPNVEHTFNYSWGVPSSRLTGVSRRVREPGVVPQVQPMLPAPVAPTTPPAGVPPVTPVGLGGR